MCVVLEVKRRFLQTGVFFKPEQCSEMQRTLRGHGAQNSDRGAQNVTDRPVT